MVERFTGIDNIPLKENMPTLVESSIFGASLITSAPTVKTLWGESSLSKDYLADLRDCPMGDLERQQIKKLEGDIMVRWVTPEIAAKFIEFVDETKQRRKLLWEIAKLTRIFLEGQFQYNGDTLRFSSTGRLIDGQNRCHGCIKSGVPFLAIIVRELSDDAFGTIDQGVVRKFRDLLQFLQVPNTAAFAPVVAHILDYENGVALGGGGERATPISNDQRQAAMDRHPGIGKAVKFVLANRDNNPGIANRRSSIIAAYYFASQSNQVLADSFVTGLLKGNDLTADSPILALRNRLINSVKERKDKDARLSTSEAALLIFKALNLHLGGAPTKLQVGGKTFPSVFGYEKFGYRKGLPADAA